MEKYKIILASSSPRRIEILKNNGINPVVIAPSVDESLPQNISPQEAVMQLSLKKALSVEAEINAGAIKEKALIIGADTLVYLDKIIGKPKDKDEAFAILSHLRGKEHFVTTGVAILNTWTGEEKVFFETTRVFFKNYSDQDILEYIETKEPYDKAGGYAIQGAWGSKVDYIMGDKDNVIGFPWFRIKKELCSYL